MRGATWEALTRDVAWKALRASGLEHRWLDTLAGLVEAKLGGQVESLERSVETVWRSSLREHLEAWPHDATGAETVARLDAQEEAMHLLSRLYVDALEWAIGVVDDRRRHDRLFPGELRAGVELPAVVKQHLTPRRTRFGWRRRAA